MCLSRVRISDSPVGRCHESCLGRLDCCISPWCFLSLCFKPTAQRRRQRPIRSRCFTGRRIGHRKGICAPESARSLSSRYSRSATAAWRRLSSIVRGVPARNRHRKKICNKTISGAGMGIGYASMLCFAVRLVLLRAKTRSQDSNCRYEKVHRRILQKTSSYCFKLLRRCR